MKVKHLALLTAAVLSCALAAAEARAQSVSVFAGGLKGPSKIIMTPRGNLVVAEGGDGPNKGRVSLIDRKTRVRRTILEGLPAGPSAADGGLSGPSGVALEGNTLYVVIGAGDGTLAGPALTLADHAAINGGAVVTMGSGVNKLSVELLTNFANYEPAPRPDFADNVRASNPFGVAVNGRLLYVVDASLNKVSARTFCRARRAVCCSTRTT